MKKFNRINVEIGVDRKPHYQIEYIENGEIYLGYCSYDFEKVLKWKEENLDVKEIVANENSKTTYEQGLADAWTAARKLICGYSIMQTREILQNTEISRASDVFNNHTPAEAIAKIKEYEDKQKEIKVGDEVCRKDRKDCKFVVTAMTKDKLCFDCISKQGVFYQICDPNLIEKTGRHFPQIEELLKAMKEE